MKHISYSLKIKAGFALLEILIVTGVIAALGTMTYTEIRYNPVQNMVASVVDGYEVRALRDAFNNYSVEHWGKHLQDESTPFVDIPVGDGPEDAVAICDYGKSSPDCFRADPLVDNGLIAQLPERSNFEDDDLTGYGVYIDKHKRAQITREWGWPEPGEGGEGDDFGGDADGDSDADADADQGGDADGDSDGDSDADSDGDGDGDSDGDDEDWIAECELNDKGKVTICHVPPGNPEAAHSITLSVNGARAHLSHHDDYCGPCEGDDE